MGEIMVIGLVLAIVFYELTDVSPGGIIVPGMLAYYLYDPRRIVMTIGIAILAMVLVKVLSSYVILYGKRKFAVHIMVAAVLGILLSLMVTSVDFRWFDIPLIGTIIAGIIAHESSRQGVWRTLAGMIVVTLLTGMVVWLL